jgi:hypothetical protein
VDRSHHPPAVAGDVSVAGIAWPGRRRLQNLVCGLGVAGGRVDGKRALRVTDEGIVERRVPEGGAAVGIGGDIAGETVVIDRRIRALHSVAVGGGERIAAAEPSREAERPDNPE